MNSSQDEPRKIKVLIVDDDDERRGRIASHLRAKGIEIIGTANNAPLGFELAAKSRPDVVVMKADMEGVGASEAMGTTLLGVEIILLLDKEDSASIRRAMLAGARDYMAKPFSMEDLEASIRRVCRVTAGHRKAPSVPAAPSSAGEPNLGRVIAVFSPKGGVGSTTVAVNLAAALWEETGMQVALVDADLQFGDVGLLMNIKPHFSISDLIQASPEIDEEMLDRVMFGHPSGLRVLLAPPRPELADLVTPEAIRTIFGILRRHYQYIVIDSGKGISDLRLSILEAAERVVIVSTPEVEAVKDCKLYLDLCEELENLAKPLLVVNQFDGRDAMSLADIEKYLGRGVDATLARDWKTARAAVDAGTPFVVSHPGQKLSKDVLRLAEEFLPVPAEVDAEAKRTRWSRLARVWHPVRNRVGRLLHSKSKVATAMLVVAVALLLAFWATVPYKVPVRAASPLVVSEMAEYGPGVPTPVPVGISATDSAGLRVGLTQFLRPFEDPDLVVPSDQELVLIAVWLGNVSASNPISVGLTDFQLVTPWNEKYSAVAAGLTDKRLWFTDMTLEPGKSSLVDLVFYVRADVKTVSLAWTSRDGITRLFAVRSSD